MQLPHVSIPFKYSYQYQILIHIFDDEFKPQTLIALDEEGKGNTFSSPSLG